MSVTWEEPPRRGVGSGITWRTREEQKLADALRARPGEWAVLDTDHMTPATRYTTAANIRNGERAAFGTGFEATCRKGKVYVRYQP